MLPTRVTVLLFFVSLLALPLGIFYPPGRWLLFAYDGFLLLAFLADAWLVSRTAAVSVRRERPARLSVGIDNEITLVLENTGPRRQFVMVRDELPPHLCAEPSLLDGGLSAHVRA